VYDHVRPVTTDRLYDIRPVSDVEVKDCHIIAMRAEILGTAETVIVDHDHIARIPLTEPLYHVRPDKPETTCDHYPGVAHARIRSVTASSISIVNDSEPTSVDATNRRGILKPLKSVTQTTGRRPRVVYWNHSPTPYFVERFNAVVARGTLDFEAWFNDRRESHRSWEVSEREWAFSARYIPRRGLLGWRERVPAAELRAVRPDLLVQEYDRGHLTAGFLAGRALADRTAFRVLPNFDSWSERTWWREAGKRFVFAAVDAAKVPGPDGRSLAERYGLPGERIAEVTQTIDFDRLADGAARAGAGREERRRELGLDGCVFVYAGRLWRGKGTDELLDAYESVRERANRPVSLLLLGDGPDEARYRTRAETLPGVVFAGFVQTREIASWYALADAMVFPTLGDPHGLVIEEAMACGLPVLSSTAAGDVSRRLGDAGLLVAPGDAGGLADAMTALAADAALRGRMGSRAAGLARARHHARYAEEFERFAMLALGLPPRRGAVARSATLAGRTLALSARRHRAAAVLRPLPETGHLRRYPQPR
jgi:glycosyltransferase involved in cell wall biosynthesis